MDVIKNSVVKGLAKLPTDELLSQSSLNDFGLKNLNLRDYQVFGVNWLYNRHRGGLGAILCDEMGLGKTCQTISFLLAVTKNEKKGSNSPNLVVCPLSVINNWSDELEKFAPSLKVIRYIGDKDTRQELRRRLEEEPDVVLTTYELCLKDEEYLDKYSWMCVVVDEGHRLKNMESQLHEMLALLKVQRRYILTGTPVQNNPSELFSLLYFTNPKIFRRSYHNSFTEHFADKDDVVSDEFLELLKPFLLRRLKEDVLKDLPSKNEVILFHPISALQKKYYKSILLRDYDAFEGSKKTRLMNTLMQLRKCVNHPYLFPGVEPEPFELGEHLVLASGKLILIDKLLKYLQTEGHKVLLFSQFTSMLDILQDYMELRGFAYERLDGSVRSEERFLAVKNFNQDTTNFVFLVSTKAGGQGLNLVSADTVVFVDSDFNPQNDLQAAARAHRIGQTRPVRIIRLVGRHTVEEIVLRKAEAKLRLTNQVLEGGHFSLGVTQDEESGKTGNEDMKDILRFGIRKLLEEDDEEETFEFEELLGGSSDGEWLPMKGKKTTEDDDEMDVDKEGQMYVFEGKDYSKESSAEDQKALEALLKEQEKAAGSTEYTLRRNTTMPDIFMPSLPIVQRKPRKPLTPEQLAERKKMREEKLERERLEAEEKAKKRKEKKKERLRKRWESASYTSLSVELVQAEDDEDDEEDEDEEDKAKPISYLIGDVVHPQKTEDNDAIICHCVDDCGVWGRGGVFDAISLRSPVPSKAYQQAGDMEDLTIGDVHLAPCDDLISRGRGGRDFVAFLVAHQRDDSGRLKSLSLRWLEECLKKVSQVALQKNASVHLPRLGYNTPSFNWYGVERCIRKYLADKGVPTFIYYYKRRAARNGDKAGPAADPIKKDETPPASDTEEEEVAAPTGSNSKTPKKTTWQKRQKFADISDSDDEEEPLPKRTKHEDTDLKGVVIHLRGVKTPGKYVEKIEKLKGRLTRNIKSVTHVVISNSSKSDDHSDIDPSVHLVSLAWLEKTLTDNRRAPEKDFPAV